MIHFSWSGYRVEWNELKNQRLKLVRGRSFEDILKMRLIGIKMHPTRHNQSIILVEDLDRIWMVPCVVTEGKVFLKTLYMSHKYSKLYRTGGLE